MIKYDLHFENKEELAKKIEDKVTNIKAKRKENNMSLFGNIKIIICGIPMFYNTEERKIVSDNELGYIEISKTSTCTESKTYFCETQFINEEDSRESVKYLKKLNNIDGNLYQTDVVISSIPELNELLKKEKFVKNEENDDNEFYKICNKDIEDGDILDNISREFKKTNSYRYIKSKMSEERIEKNTLDKLKEFDIINLIVLTTYRNMLKKFLKRGKTKGFYRKNNKKSKID